MHACAADRSQKEEPNYVPAYRDTLIAVSSKQQPILLFGPWLGCIGRWCRHDQREFQAAHLMPSLVRAWRPAVEINSSSWRDRSPDGEAYVFDAMTRAECRVVTGRWAND